MLHLDEVKAVFVFAGCGPASSVREQGEEGKGLVVSGSHPACLCLGGW